MKDLLTILAFCLITTCGLAQKSWAQPVDAKVVRTYPNPATSFITFDIQRPVERGYVIQIYNFIGRRILTIAVTGNKMTVPLDNFFRGVYIFQLRDKNGSIIESNKFQVNK